MTWQQPGDAQTPSPQGGHPQGDYIPPEAWNGAPTFPAMIVPPPVEDPTPYHRLFRTSRAFAWWRPLVAVAVFVAFFLVSQVFVAVVWVIALIASGAGLTDFTSVSGVMGQLTDISNPMNLFLLLGSVAIMLPLVPLAMLCAGLRPVSLRHSVAFRIRWRWMLWCAIPALVITVLSTGLSFLPLLWGDTLEPVPVDAGRFALLAVLIIVLVPLQSAAEEYVFRGLIMQTIGAWVRSPWVGIIVSTVVFTVGHTQYEIWGLLSVGVMGLGFAIVVWRTGGLEAGIAFHVVNNVVALLLLASGALGTTVMSSEGSDALAPVVQAVFTAGFVVWVEFAARRQGISRERPLPQAAPYAAPAVPPQPPTPAV
ncbi:MAG TPA: CPBP family intramembrane glutamic endopeptidase [Protaetiibacter sp.]|nr:CPBP family intramembrane glutamic endopeptidase [Protaetiibacter sp.]